MLHDVLCSEMYATCIILGEYVKHRNWYYANEAFWMAISDLIVMIAFYLRIKDSKKIGKKRVKYCLAIWPSLNL